MKCLYPQVGSEAPGKAGEDDAELCFPLPSDSPGRHSPDLFSFLIVSHRADWQLLEVAFPSKCGARRSQTASVDKPWRQKPGDATSMIEISFDVTYRINHNPGVTKYVICHLYCP